MEKKLNEEDKALILAIGKRNENGEKPRTSSIARDVEMKPRAVLSRLNDLEKQNFLISERSGYTRPALTIERKKGLYTGDWISLLHQSRTLLLKFLDEHKLREMVGNKRLKALEQNLTRKTFSAIREMYNETIILLRKKKMATELHLVWVVSPSKHWALSEKGELVYDDLKSQQGEVESCTS